MLRSALITLICLFSVNTFAQQFTLNGNITGAPEGAKVFINYVNSKGKGQRDSTVITGGKFILSGSVAGPYMAYLSFYEPNSKVLKGNTQFFLEPANITATGDYASLKSLQFSGSVTQAEYDVLLKQINANNDRMRPQHDAYDRQNLEYARLKKANPDDKTPGQNGRVAGFDARDH